MMQASEAPQTSNHLVMIAPNKANWRKLCAEAEHLLDADVDAYRAAWLPRTLEHLEAWPESSRRCPPRWFTTPRPHAELLLALGATPPEELESWSPHRDPDGMWILQVGELEFAVSGSELHPPPLPLLLVDWIRASWTDLNQVSIELLERLADARGPNDPWLEAPPPQGRARWYLTDLVTIDNDKIPNFTIDVCDEGHRTNGWPYGQWAIEYRWGRPARVLAGTESYNVTVWRAP